MNLAKPLHWFLSAVALLLGVAATVPLGLSPTTQAIFFAGASLLGTWGVTPAVVSAALAAKFKGVSLLITALLAASAVHSGLLPAATDPSLVLAMSIGLKILGIAGTLLAALGQGAAPTLKARMAAAKPPLDQPPKP